MAESGCREGCLSKRAVKVASSRGAKVSSELANLTAPLKSPSSSLAETRVASDLRGSQVGGRILLGRGLASVSGGSISASICLLTRVAKEHCCDCL